MPHMSQTAWGYDGNETIIVNEQRYRRGRASGHQNNCLLDTLRQKLGLVVNVEVVRDELQRRFPSGLAFVGKSNYLTLDYHWMAAIDLLFQADTSGMPKLDHRRFRIICVDLRYIGNGDVVGEGPREVIIARENANHFIPLHPGAV